MGPPLGIRQGEPMSPSGEYALMVAMFEGANIKEVAAIAAERDSERVMAAIWAEEFDTAKTLRPVTPTGFASSYLDDDSKGRIR